MDTFYNSSAIRLVVFRRGTANKGLQIMVVSTVLGRQLAMFLAQTSRLTAQTHHPDARIY